MAKRTPTGKVRVGEQKNQNVWLTGVVTFTGSTIIDLQRTLFKRSKKVDSFGDYQVFTSFEDAGGIATVTRLAIQKNTDGTFTINASKDTAAAGVLAVATNACTVRWFALVIS